MARICFSLFLLVQLFQTSAQQSVELGTEPEKMNSELSITGFSYPTFLNGETHSYFRVGYPFDAKFQGELQGFYDTYILADVTRFALIGKYYSGDKLYFFSGTAVEFERDKTSGDTSPPRMFLLNGVNYDFNDQLNLELKHEVQINKNGSGFYGIPNLFSVHGKYKF